ncbi:guanine nucleotide-binding protein subunit gamma 2-like isoform X2 [Rutidosis leptorrhynchoides]|uniref:guanine nucleotide-binding protein subunit gamma 2-like isoform X2 n=1 Tax=Rutidosis leptorrhynchoides TaxID=125765 RepID=UPI003A9926CF
MVGGFTYPKQKRKRKLNELLNESLWVPLLASEELDQLEKMETASASCKEFLNNVETKPDPLLPTTSGPTNPSWDQWFEGPQDKSGCRCWIL